MNDVESRARELQNSFLDLVELIQTFDELVENNKILKEKLDAKMQFINNGMEEEQYALQEENITLKERVEELELFINDLVFSKNEIIEFLDRAKQLLE